MKNILINRDAKGKIRIVDIACFWSDDLHSYVLDRKTSQYGGKVTEQPIIEIHTGKANRTVTEQAKLMFASHVKKYLDKGYKNITDFGFNTLEECNFDDVLLNETTDQNGAKKVMLAKNIEGIALSNFEKDWYSSRKLDGTRCTLYYDGESIRSASRGGGDYDIPSTYIRNNPILIEWFKEHPDMVLDGELYIHGRCLAYISGLCRLETLSERHKELKFYIYDLAIPDVIFKDRLDLLLEYEDELSECENIVFLEHKLVNSWGNIQRLHNIYVEEGYEGEVIRDPNKVYGFNRRSNAMLKIKLFTDDEYKIIGIKEGLRDEDMVFVLETKHDGEFSAKPVGDRSIKEDYRKNINDIIGRYGTVKHFGFTVNNLPNLPVFKAIRYDLDDN